MQALDLERESDLALSTSEEAADVTGRWSELVDLFEELAGEVDTTRLKCKFWLRAGVASHRFLEETERAIHLLTRVIDARDAWFDEAYEALLPILEAETDLVTALTLIRIKREVATDPLIVAELLDREAEIQLELGEVEDALKISRDLLARCDALDTVEAGPIAARASDAC